MQCSTLLCCATGAAGDAPVAGGRKRKGPKKPYFPQMGTANYAFLITLYQVRTVTFNSCRKLVQDASLFRQICSGVTRPSLRSQADQYRTTRACSQCSLRRASQLLQCAAALANARGSITFIKLFCYAAAPRGQHVASDTSATP